ncbi:MAG: hypothetical protein D6719_08850 [Candidatus Dadabacteria bacterium]|nr:MAG: hypothetical protein D6719_08850 [Candidatus Dadabacteria bacterium]
MIKYSVVTEANRYKSYEQKLKAAADLYWAARSLKEAYLRSRHPDWPEEKIKKTVKEWLLYAKS